MIVAVCLNPSFDRTVEVEAIRIGSVNRILASRLDLGGKGLNVARVIRRLGGEACCVSLAGAEDAAAVEAGLRQEGIACRVQTVPGRVRVNLKVVSRDGQPVSEFNEPGPEATPEAMEGFLHLLDEKGAQHGSWYVLTGSLPPGCIPGTYAQLMKRLDPSRCILDVGGRELLLGLAARPYLVKPNREEMEMALGRSVKTVGEVLAACREMMTMGAQNVLASLGGDGCVLLAPSGAWYAPALNVPVQSTVGAGDAMVAGLLCGLEKTGTLYGALPYAVASGAASVMTPGTELVRPEDVQRLLPQVKLERLEGGA